jgi:hypothetical protein
LTPPAGGAIVGGIGYLRDHPRRSLMKKLLAIFIVLALAEDEEEAKR